MATPKTHQLRGRKEAPLAVVGIGLVPEPQHKKILTPDDAEYHYYSELLKGFFEKFTRWQGVLSTEEHLKDEERRSGSVFHLDTGFIMTPATSMAKDDPENKILQITDFTFNDPEPGFYDTRFIIRPAPAGKHLLIDPEDNKPLEEIEIHVGDQTIVPWGSKCLEIQTKRLGDRPEERLNYRGVKYDFQGHTLEVCHNFLVRDVTTDEMVTSLINTIDRLIPRTTTTTPQAERRASQETLTPMKLPPPRRTRPPGR